MTKFAKNLEVLRKETTQAREKFAALLEANDLWFQSVEMAEADFEKGLRSRKLQLKRIALVSYDGTFLSRNEFRRMLKVFDWRTNEGPLWKGLERGPRTEFRGPLIGEEFQPNLTGWWLQLFNEVPCNFPESVVGLRGRIVKLGSRAKFKAIHREYRVGMDLTILALRELKALIEALRVKKHFTDAPGFKFYFEDDWVTPKQFTQEAEDQVEDVSLDLEFEG